MRFRSKSLPLFLIALLAVSGLGFMTAKPASAQTIPTPSVPQFTLKFVSQPYYVAPITTTDPYTGKSVIIQAGYYAQNQSIAVTIKNQPFTPYPVNGSEVSVYYQIQYKGHYGTSWQPYYYSNVISPIQLSEYLVQSNSSYTVILVPSDSDEVPVGSITNFPAGGQVDFQVRALIGYITITNYFTPFLTDYLVFHGQTSDWSLTQTITIPASSSSSPSNTTQIPTSTPTVPELTYCALSIVLFFGTITIIVLVFKRVGHLFRRAEGAESVRGFKRSSN